MCLNERNEKLQDVKKELERLDIEYRKADFEEDMYARLKESGVLQYCPIFCEKHNESMEHIDKIEKEKQRIKTDIMIIEKEMEYINELIRRN